MRICKTSIFLGPLVLACSMASLAQAANPHTEGVPGVGVSVPYTADDASTGDRQTYAQKARDDLRDWRARLDKFNADAKATGHTVSKEAAHDLHVAWQKTQLAAAKLQHAGARGWAGAKASYEKASDGLANTWHKIHPET